MEEIFKLNAYEIKKLIEEKKIKAEEVTESYLKRIDKVDNKIGAFLYVSGDEAIKNAKKIDEKIAKGEKVSALAGIPIALKDNISAQGMQNSCASKILEGYISPYDATVTEKIKKNDAVIIGKTNMDEFAMGSSTENSSVKITKNPWDTERIPGGSSGGSASAVAAMEAPLALGTDTGGSVRQPASLCGVVGLKPTYGRISRYGVIAFGSTLDQIGTFARSVKDTALLLGSLAGLDDKDSTTCDKKVTDYLSDSVLNMNIKGKKIGIPKEFFGDGIQPGVMKSIEEAIRVFKENGAEVSECSVPLSTYSLADYYIISSAEASSNLARFDGVRYGARSKNATDATNIYYKSRSEGFGPEVKRRIMLGTYVLSAGYYDAYYKKALKVRKLIKDDFEKAFKEYDVLLCPTSPQTAFKVGEKTKNVLSMYMSDICTVPVNIAGLPAISVPCGLSNGLPVGLQLIGNYFKEDTLFNMAYSFEQSTDWHKLMPDLK